MSTDFWYQSLISSLDLFYKSTSRHDRYQYLKVAKIYLYFLLKEFK